ncbi:DUF7833 domain-containing protein [Dyadobacter sp. OTU695]|uniref:DUF7833 domain-containing protein n=1 Tax=Dyadobacter sp. OTU695 TaxID=3043860 RepID=UPI00313E4A03
MNYIKEVSQFWDDAPHMDGYKSDFGLLYLALIDSVNRNFWRDTEIEYDRLINKTKLSKRVYLEGRAWLLANGFIIFTPGKNDYAKAKFNIAVRNCTATDTTSDTATDTANSTATDTATDTTTETATVSSTAPIYNKTKNNKTINKEEEEARENFSPSPIEVLVEDFKNSRKGDPPELRGSPLTLDEYEVLLGDNRLLLETSCKNRKLSEQQYRRALAFFFADKRAVGHQPKSQQDVTQHFLNWLPKWKESEQTKTVKGKLTQTVEAVTEAAAESEYFTFNDLNNR